LQRRDAGVQVALDIRQADTDDGVVEKGEEEDRAQRGQSQCLRGRTETTCLDVEAGRRPVNPGGDNGTLGPFGQQWSPFLLSRARARVTAQSMSMSFAYPPAGYWNRNGAPPERWSAG
jgi:hypothetical protein